MIEKHVTLWMAFQMCIPLADASAGDAFFESKARPLLVKRCYEYHRGAKTRGGLSLDTRAGWQKGGDTGPAIVPGRPEKSLLIEAINYGSLEMPPAGKGGKLPAAAIAVLTNGWPWAHITLESLQRLRLRC